MTSIQINGDSGSNSDSDGDSNCVVSYTTKAQAEKGEEIKQVVRTKKVVCNIDVPAFENNRNFIPSGKRDNRAAEARSSASVLSLSIAFNTTLFPLAHHSLFLSKDFEESWKVVEQSEGGSVKFDPR